MDLIDREQTIEKVRAVAKTAEWIESTESCMRPFMCSNCGCIYDVDTFMGEPVWNYCPHCGARMVD